MGYILHLLPQNREGWGAGWGGQSPDKGKRRGAWRVVDRRGFASSLLKKGRVELLKKGFGDALSATPHREVFGVSVLFGL